MRHHEIGGVQVFGLVPRARHIRIAVDAVIEIIGVAPQLLAQPGVVIIHQIIAAPALARKVQETIVQDHVLKAHLRTLGVDVHLAHGLRLVAVTGELAGQRHGVIPWHAVLVAHAPVGALRLAGEQRRSRRNAGGRSGIGSCEARPIERQLIEIGRMHHGVPGDAQAIAAPLIHHNQDHIRSVGHGISSSSDIAVALARIL